MSPLIRLFPMKKIIIPLVIILISAGALAHAATPRNKKAKPRIRHNRIAVVKSRYDPVDVVLQNFQIPYDLIQFRDLENRELILRYDSLFVPSGVDNPMEESLDVFANVSHLKSVTLKPDFYEVDRDKVAKTIRRFVRGGGAAYFSGYSFEYLQQAFGLFEFFDNFPFMGMPARVEAVVDHDLARFCMKDRIALYLDHPGWVAVKSSKDSEIIAAATYETPRGMRTGPISVIARRGDGELLYTSYDSTVFSSFRRFNIYRIAGAPLLNRLEAAAARWSQRITGRIVDSVHAGEYAGMHRLDLDAGNNTIYFFSARDRFQIDILDRNLSLIESRDLTDREQEFTVRSDTPDVCYIRLYPSSEGRFGMYAVVSAAGRRVLPYFYETLIGIAIALAAAGAAAVFRLYFSSGYSGRWRG